MRKSAWFAFALAVIGLAARFDSAWAQDEKPTKEDKPQEKPKEEPKEGSKEEPKPAGPEKPTDEAKAPLKDEPKDPAIDAGKAAAREAERDVDNYRLRIGDQVEIKVFNGNKLTPEQSTILSVPGQGGASLPPIGRIDLRDRTVFEVQEQVRQKYKDDGYLQNPNVGCVVVVYEPRLVYLIGAVHGTVDLPVQRGMRILEVLAKAGSLGTSATGAGPTGYAGSSSAGADFSHVRVRRVMSEGRPFTFEINVDDILERNQEQQNIVMFENDIVIVPRLEGSNPQSSDFVYVLGKVKSPGRQPIVKGRTAFTLTKLIALCGDFQDFADRTKVRIIRTTPTGRIPYTIDFDDIISGDRPDFEMMPDDLVYVPENWI